MDLQWNVFYYDNGDNQKPAVSNIFNHRRFHEDVMNDFKRASHNRDAFEKALRNALMYYFWCKCEWESLISPWPCKDPEHESFKVDVFWQVYLNWERFSDYVWNTLCAGEGEKR